MNYYRRYVGDYLRDTARLSVLEHGVYSLLLDYYYAEERPISLDLGEVYRMVRAILPEERAAVDRVLTTYFTKHDDGFHNARADAEIELAVKARSNGAKGGRPTTKDRTDEVTDTVTGGQTGTVTGMGGKNGHPPTTNHQPPTSSRQPVEKALSGEPDGEGRSGNFREAKAIAGRVLAYLNEKAGTKYRGSDAHLRLMMGRVTQDGATEADMRAVVDAKVAEWGKDPEKRRYLSPDTLFNATKFGKYIGQVGVTAAAGAGARAQLVGISIEEQPGRNGKPIVTFNASGEVNGKQSWDALMRLMRNPGYARRVRDAKGKAVVVWVERGEGDARREETVGRYSAAEVVDGFGKLTA